jgi:hypothetical protein
MNPLLLHCLIVLPFWVLLTVAAVRKRASWFPFTVMAPLVFVLLGTWLDRVQYPVGIVLTGGFHGFLWGLLVYVFVIERKPGTRIQCQYHPEDVGRSTDAPGSKREDEAVQDE